MIIELNDLTLMGLICAAMGIALFLIGCFFITRRSRIVVGALCVIATLIGLMVGRLVDPTDMYALVKGGVFSVLMLCIILYVLSDVRLTVIVTMIASVVLVMFGGLSLGNVYPNLFSIALGVQGLIVFPAAGILVAYHEQQLGKTQN